MKTLRNIILITTLLLGSVYAQENEMSIKKIRSGDYRINIKAKHQLKLGKNEITVRIKHKEHILRNAYINFDLYLEDDNIVPYKTIKNIKNSNYNFNINLKKKGQYGYLLTFRNKAGVTHFVRGNFKI